MHFMLALASLLGLLVSAFATSLPWPEVAPQFNGILAGHTVSLNGTIQEMMSQAVAMYPDFNPNDIKKSLASRTEADNDGEHCCPVPGTDWNYAATSAISDGVSYLNGIGSISYSRKSCGRISCSYASAIYVCNDNDWTITMPGSDPANYANLLIEECSQYPPFGYQLTCGQAFDTGHWNTIVRDDSC